MDALLSAFLAALIAEQGDASQLLAVLALARFGQTRAVTLGLCAAALASAVVSAGAGAAVHALIPYRGALLLTVLALLFAAGGMAFAPRAPKVQLYPRLGACAATLVAGAVQMFGDRTQFLVFALAARSDAPWLAALGGAAGTCLGLAPALLLGERFASVWPATGLRRGGAALLGLAGIAVLLATLRLI